MYIGYNIKMNIEEIGWEGMGWNNLAQYRYKWRMVLKTVTKFKAGNFTS
jgi:hypothetical protein